MLLTPVSIVSIEYHHGNVHDMLYKYRNLILLSFVQNSLIVLSK